MNSHRICHILCRFNDLGSIVKSKEGSNIKHPTIMRRFVFTPLVWTYNVNVLSFENDAEFYDIINLIITTVSAWLDKSCLNYG